MEKDLHTIGVITDDESTKESKDIEKRSQASVSKAKEKEASGIENLNHLLKSLTSEVVELKQQTREKTVGSMPPKYLLNKNVLQAASGQPNLRKAPT